MRGYFALAVALIGTTAFATPAAAGPLFEVVTTGGPTRQANTPTSTDGTSAGGTPGIELSTNGGAQAGAGFVGAAAQSSTLKTLGSGGRITTSHFSSALMRIDDLVISGPDDADIMVSLNLALAGSIQTSRDLISPLFSGGLMEASSTVNYSVQLRRANGFVIHSDSGSVDVLNRDTDGSFLAGPDITRVRSTGLFGDTLSDSSTGFSIMSRGTTSFPLSERFIGDPLVLEMFLTVFASTIADDATGTALASAQFGNTISFAIDGPVFTLPGGFTADSAQGNIANNLFFLPGATPASEPATLALFGIALAGLALRRRKRAAS